MWKTSVVPVRPLKVEERKANFVEVSYAPVTNVANAAESVANGVANTLSLAIVDEAVRMALSPVDPKTIEPDLKPRRGDRVKYNARQREYMKQVRARKKLAEKA